MKGIDSDAPQPRITPEHGIAVVERRTGVSQYVLRAWEKRYGAVNPFRDSEGRRLYSDDDIERIRLLRTVSAGGRRIGIVASLSVGELRSLARNDARNDVVVRGRAPLGEAATADADQLLRECIDAVHGMDGAVTYVLLMRAVAELGPVAFVDSVASPLLKLVGDEWASGGLRPVNEHALSVALRRVLSWLLEKSSAPYEAPLLLFATLPHEAHEFGAMFAAIIAGSHQRRVSYLGPDLPVDDIAYAARRLRADVVGVSMTRSADETTLYRDVELLRAALPRSVELLIGGEAAISHEQALGARGVTVLVDRAAWESWLQSTLATE